MTLTQETSVYFLLEAKRHQSMIFCKGRYKVIYVYLFVCLLAG